MRGRLREVTAAGAMLAALLTGSSTWGQGASAPSPPVVAAPAPSVPQSPTYSFFSIDSKTQSLTILYTLAEIKDGRFEVTQGAPAKNSQILINTTLPPLLLPSQNATVSGVEE